MAGGTTWNKGKKGIARPHGRARIETTPASAAPLAASASPDLTVGRGLKLITQRASFIDHMASPDREARESHIVPQCSPLTRG